MDNLSEILTEHGRILRDQYDRAVADGNRISDSYIKPFDALLERKAEYYMQLENSHKSRPILLKEIEVMDRMRDYISMLESMWHTEMDKCYVLANRANDMKNLAEYWKTRYRNTAQWSILWRESFEALESKLTRLHPCNQHSTK